MACSFIAELSKLRKLSVESVENTTSFDEFKIPYLFEIVFKLANVVLWPTDKHRTKPCVFLSSVANAIPCFIA